jgi:hypothetical protein
MTIKRCPTCRRVIPRGQVLCRYHWRSLPDVVRHMWQRQLRDPYRGSRAWAEAYQENYREIVRISRALNEGVRA